MWKTLGLRRRRVARGQMVGRSRKCERDRERQRLSREWRSLCPTFGFGLLPPLLLLAAPRLRFLPQALILLVAPLLLRLQPSLELLLAANTQSVTWETGRW